MGRHHWGEPIREHLNNLHTLLSVLVEAVRPSEQEAGHTPRLELLQEHCMVDVTERLREVNEEDPCLGAWLVQLPVQLI